MAELQGDETLSTNEMLQMMSDMNEGYQPDVENGRVLGTYATTKDMRLKLILHRFIRKEVEHLTVHRDAVAKLLLELAVSEDHASLQLALEAVYHLPYKPLALLLKDLSTTVMNSLTLTTFPKSLVQLLVDLRRKPSISTST